MYIFVNSHCKYCHMFIELHSSFVSLAWFQSGRSLSPGNQWGGHLGGVRRVGGVSGCIGGPSRDSRYSGSRRGIGASAGIGDS